MGRASQVKEVVGRLKATHFVAVVGGSGSGKSSLVRAGVVPSLRGYGIPDAGSYWIPVVSTPGTTPHEEPPLDGQTGDAKDLRADQTPVTRLAWKFSHSLKPLDSPEEEAERRSQIATVFRQGSGFARLVKVYSSDLAQVGPDVEDARFLFVIDQFEELFHPNNHGNNDAQLMVEAVIDHFFNPHERCFVVITMRSEHLSDCAAYLELPDAINESLYLVRRLNAQELRDAIVGPAKYYLRLLQRKDDQEHAVASDVVFDESVVQRLVQDAGSIAWDADHLPLLQHVLARMWRAACARENLQAGDVPERVSEQDLEHAVLPDGDRTDGWLGGHEALNTLRASLENWADFTYREHSQEERAQIEIVLRHLAYKDPNNGMYFQQRVDVDDPRLLPGVPQPRDQLHRMLDRGFLDTVNYMFWDDENPDRVTVKVSHEAFIRGWDRFRKVIDAEADRFDEFVAVLRKCSQWKVECDEKFLLESSEQQRVDAAGLNEIFQSHDERKDWFRVLLQYRDGERLAKIEPDVDAFLAASRERLAKIEREKRDAAEREHALKEKAFEAERERQMLQLKADAQQKEDEARRLQAEAAFERARAVATRNRVAAWSAAGSTLFLAGIAGFAVFVELPAMHSIDKFADARSKVERRQAGIAQNVPATERLRTFVDAARLVDEAKAGESILGIKTNRVLDWFDWVPPVKSTKGVLNKTSSEPVVAGTFRNLLTTAVWPTLTDPVKVGDKVVKPKRVDAQCGGAAANRTGSLFLGKEADRGIFVPATVDRDGELRLYSAAWKNSQCTATALSYSLPAYLDPALLFDADISHFAVALKGTTQSPDYVNLYRVNWERDPKGGIAANVQLLSLVPDLIVTELTASGGQASRSTPAATLVRNELKTGHDGPVRQAKVVPTWPASGGREVSVAGRAWRLFSEAAEPIAASDDWSELKTFAANSGCARLDPALEAQKPAGATRTMLQHGAACFDILQGGVASPPDSQPSDVSPPAPSDRQPLLVSVYAEPQLESTNTLTANPPTPIASVAFGLAAPSTHRWLVGNPDSAHEGWIALDVRDAQAAPSPAALLASPWSIHALRALGLDVLKASAETGIGPAPRSVQPATPLLPTASR